MTSLTRFLQIKPALALPTVVLSLFLLTGCGCKRQCSFDESGIPADPKASIPVTTSPESKSLHQALAPPNHMHTFTVSYTARSGGYKLQILDQQPYANQWWILAEVRPPPPDMMTTMALEELVKTTSTPVPPELVRVFLVARDAGFGDQKHTLIPDAQTFYEALRTPSLH